MAWPLLAATINSLFGFILAWILVRYDFPGRRLADGVIDLPFAMPSVVAGIGLMSLYSPVGAFGRWLRPDTPLGEVLAQLGVENVNLTSSVFGILLANLFVTLPFVVRSVQPAILAIEADVIEAAQTLGSLRWQTFRRIILPPLLPAVTTGFTLAFARCVGEYGVVTLISGNIPFRTMISSVYIFRRLEAFDLSGATAVGLLLLVFALVIIAAVNTVQWWSQRKQAV
ncbi:MAG: ABC transporter permease subunit [Synechococcaceae cyanobacterium SM2_3_60]|nr:ABC transporter permease subunit [Synechococcaceae cyanobacterium SM2_3_60]